MKKFIFAIAGSALLLLLFFYRVPIREAAQDFFKPELPEPKESSEFAKPPSLAQPSGNPASSPGGAKSPSPGGSPAPAQTPGGSLAPTPPSSSLPASINLKVPFGSQAPHANWDMPYQEACEEASMIMVQRYFKNLALDANTMDAEILKVVEWQEKTFGYYKDTSAAEMARTLREHFGMKNIEIRYDFTLEEIKKEVANGHPVILPAAGRLLPNPNFRQPGPYYHALVVKGFLKNGKIITNDPGTRNGADFIYDADVLMNAVHDWDPKDILSGRKAMIVVKW